MEKLEAIAFEKLKYERSWNIAIYNDCKQAAQ
ncbi:hypothetical protein TNCV_1780251, partial [Trichonephila clavipes]